MAGGAFRWPWTVVTESSGPETGSLTAHCPVSPSLEWQGQGLPPTIPHLAGINATLKVAGTEHLGLDLVPIEVRAVADIIADYGDSGLLEYSSLLAWGCAGKAGESWRACTPPFPPGAHSRLLSVGTAQGQEAPNLPDCPSPAQVSLPDGGFPGRGWDSP